jgi:hypothetical protein
VSISTNYGLYIGGEIPNEVPPWRDVRTKKNKSKINSKIKPNETVCSDDLRISRE